MALPPVVGRFPLRPESELVVLCARTAVSDGIKEQIRQKAQEPLDWAIVLDLIGYHGVVPIVYRNLTTLCSDLVPAESLARLRQKTQAIALLNRLIAQELVVLCEASLSAGCRLSHSKERLWHCRRMAMSLFATLTIST